MLKLLRLTPVLLSAALAIFPAYSQHRVALQNMHERLILIVPMIGSGTPEDPRRPMYVPVPKAGAKPEHDGIIGFSYQLSDDGRSAIVELVARDRAAFHEILESKRGDVRVFEKGKDKKNDINKEFRKSKNGFDLDQLSAGAL